MTHRAPLFAFALALVATAVTLAGPPAMAKGKSTIYLDGLPENVMFNDGDSFRILDGPRKGQKARLVGYNTLESHGPVHFWGDFHGWELYRTHTAATELAGSRDWDCTSDGEADGYGRILVVCPELRKELIRRGLAHVYAYGSEPDPELVELQMKAQNERVGMWAKGIPRAIVTSVHSIDEGEDEDDLTADIKPKREKSYNRMADTRTGKTFTIEHTATFKTCDVFCYAGSCMLYIPFSARYGDKKAACLKGDLGESNRLRPDPHLTEPLPKYRD